MATLLDNDPMPQKGEYFGEQMENVPYSYLFWLEGQPFCRPDVEAYIEYNRDVLDKERKEAESRKY